MLFDLPKDEPSIIKIIGVGGGGSNAVTHMYKQGIVGVDYAICNTDAQAMHLSPVPTKISLGQILTEGRGAGSKPSVGKQACLESLDEIKRFLEDGTKMVFITAGMGGGTGTGAAPIIAKASQELGILTVGIVTLPFTFEGKTRVGNGMEWLEDLRKNVDCLVIISNDKLRDIYGNLTISAAFSEADNILCTAAKGIAEIITVPGYVNVDFEDVNTTMRGSGVAIMGTATLEGENRAFRAADEALRSPLLEDNDIYGAKNILVNITSGAKEATMDEIFEITQFVQEKAGENANLIWGNCFDERLGEKLAVTIIATGFEVAERGKLGATDQSQANPTNRQIVHLDEDHEITGKIKNHPSLFTVTSHEPYIPVDEKAASMLEFEFDNIRESVDKIRRTTPVNNDPYLRDEEEELSPEERRSRIEQAQRRRQEALARPINVVKLSSPQTIIDLESQPAYLRRSVNLDDVPDSEKQTMSNWTISLEEEGEIKVGGNSYLHDNVD
ncbi:MAG: cell division protein FtsZ [Saprospiraceae bacterium]